MIKKYLAELHTKPDHHKKRFSLLVSGCFTLLIFAVWSQVKFGADVNVVADAPAPVEDTAVSPFEGLSASVSDSWKMLTGELGKAQEGLKSVDIQDSYTEVRNNALNNQYGQQ